LFEKRRELIAEEAEFGASKADLNVVASLA
jgi:hypothetical protein